MDAKELSDLLDAISEVTNRMSRNLKKIMARKENMANVRYCVKTQKCCSVD